MPIIFFARPRIVIFFKRRVAYHIRCLRTAAGRLLARHGPFDDRRPLYFPAGQLPLCGPMSPPIIDSLIWTHCMSRQDRLPALSGAIARAAQMARADWLPPAGLNSGWLGRPSRPWPTLMVEELNHPARHAVYAESWWGYDRCSPFARHSGGKIGTRRHGAAQPSPDDKCFLTPLRRTGRQPDMSVAEMVRRPSGLSESCSSTVSRWTTGMGRRCSAHTRQTYRGRPRSSCAD